MADFVDGTERERCHLPTAPKTPIVMLDIALTLQHERARTMESLSKSPIDPDLAFLTGLLSMLDQFVGRPIAGNRGDVTMRCA